MRECAYDSAFMFKYSERPGTYASKHLPDDVPEEVKIRRLNEIIELQNQLSAESNAKDVGKTFEVMVEGVSNVRKNNYSAVHSRIKWWCSTAEITVSAICKCTHNRSQFCHTERRRSFLMGKKKHIKKRTCSICRFFLPGQISALYPAGYSMRCCRQVPERLHPLFVASLLFIIKAV